MVANEAIVTLGLVEREPWYYTANSLQFRDPPIRTVWDFIVNLDEPEFVYFVAGEGTDDQVWDLGANPGIFGRMFNLGTLFAAAGDLLILNVPPLTYKEFAACGVAIRNGSIFFGSHGGSGTDGSGWQDGFGVTVFKKNGGFVELAPHLVAPYTEAIICAVNYSVNNRIYFGTQFDTSTPTGHVGGPLGGASIYTTDGDTIGGNILTGGQALGGWAVHKIVEFQGKLFAVHSLSRRLTRLAQSGGVVNTIQIWSYDGTETLGLTNPGSTSTLVQVKTLTPPVASIDEYAGKYILFTNDTPTVALQDIARPITANTLTTLTLGSALPAVPAEDDLFRIVGIWNLESTIEGYAWAGGMCVFQDKLWVGLYTFNKGAESQVGSRGVFSSSDGIEWTLEFDAFTEEVIDILLASGTTHTGTLTSVPWNTISPGSPTLNQYAGKTLVFDDATPTVALQGTTAFITGNDLSEFFVAGLAAICGEGDIFTVNDITQIAAETQWMPSIGSMATNGNLLYFGLGCYDGGEVNEDYPSLQAEVWVYDGTNLVRDVQFNTAFGGTIDASLQQSVTALYYDEAAQLFWAAIGDSTTFDGPYGAIIFNTKIDYRIPP